jgi:hypothetical protein
MRINTLGKLVLLLFKTPDVFLGRRKYIFLLSHMRSYSTLLCHILGSHSEVSGYSEARQAYVGIRDLFTLRYKVYLTNNNSLNEVLYWIKSFIIHILCQIGYLKEMISVSFFC